MRYSSGGHRVDGGRTGRREHRRLFWLFLSFFFLTCHGTATAAPRPSLTASDTITVTATVPLMETFVQAVRQHSSLRVERPVLRLGAREPIALLLTNGEAPMRGHLARLFVTDRHGAILWEQQGRTGQDGYLEAFLETGPDWPERLTLRAEYLQYPDRPVLLPDTVAMGFPREGRRPPVPRSVEGILCGRIERDMMTANSVLPGTPSGCSE